jgi:cytochrome c oxidase subunit 4
MSEHAHEQIVPGQESTHHVTGVFTFTKVLAALTVLMILTIYAAEGLHLTGLVGNIVALAIACTKATLVVMFFMGVLYATKLTKLYAVLGFIWVTLLGITFCDYFTRSHEVAPSWLGERASQLTAGEIPEAGNELPRQTFGSP